MHTIVFNPKFAGLLKLNVRDASFTPQCLVFWNCLRREDVVVGQTYRLTVLSTAVVKAGGLAKKKATKDTKHYASYGTVDMSFGSSTEFMWQVAAPADAVPDVPAHIGTVSPSVAMTSPLGVTAVLLDVTGIIAASVGRRDAQERPFCEFTLQDSDVTLRVRLRHPPLTFPRCYVHACIRFRARATAGYHLAS